MHHARHRGKFIIIIIIVIIIINTITKSVDRRAVYGVLQKYHAAIGRESICQLSDFEATKTPRWYYVADYCRLRTPPPQLIIIIASEDHSILNLIPRCPTAHLPPQTPYCTLKHVHSTALISPATRSEASTRIRLLEVWFQYPPYVPSSAPAIS